MPRPWPPRSTECPSRAWLPTKDLRTGWPNRLSTPSRNNSDRWPSGASAPRSPRPCGDCLMKIGSLSPHDTPARKQCSPCRRADPPIPKRCIGDSSRCSNNCADTCGLTGSTLSKRAGSRMVSEETDTETEFHKQKTPDLKVRGSGYVCKMTTCPVSVPAA